MLDKDTNIGTLNTIAIDTEQHDTRYIPDYDANSRFHIFETVVKEKINSIIQNVDLKLFCSRKSLLSNCNISYYKILCIRESNLMIKPFILETPTSLEVAVSELFH